MHDAMTRRSALCGLAALPAVVNLVDVQDVGAEIDDDDFDEALDDPRCDSEAAADWSQFVRTAVIAEIPNWREVANTGGGTWKEAVASCGGFYGDADRAKAAYADMLAAIRAAALPILGHGQSVDGRAFEIFVGAECDQVRRVCGGEWDDDYRAQWHLPGSVEPPHIPGERLALHCRL